MNKIYFMQTKSGKYDNRDENRRYIDVLECDLAHASKLIDKSDTDYIVEVDDNLELLNIVPRLSGRLHLSRVIVVGSMNKDYYFGDKHLVSPVEEIK